MNRISHRDWVKLCVDPNGRIKLRAKQKYEIPSATDTLWKELIEYTFFSLEIINSKNRHKNILEISDQNRINIEGTLLYFSTNQLKTQNKNILENSAQKLINRKIFRLQNKLVIIWIWLG